MKVLMVGENRDMLNWGGRGQSIALYRLLNETFNVEGSINGNSVTSVMANDGYINTLTPRQINNLFLRIRNKYKFIDLYMKVQELLGARDFINDDPEESAAMLIHYKSRRFGLSSIYEMVKNSDMVVINGEGSGVLSTPYRRDFFFYLMMIELSVQLKKHVFYVNGIISDCPITGRNLKSLNAARKTLRKCNAVALRDPESFEFVKREMPNVNCDYIPDALFTWFPIYESVDSALPMNGDFIIPFPDKEEYFNKLDFSRPYICVGGSSLAAYNQENAFSYYSYLVEKVGKLGFSTYLTECCGGDRFLQRVANKLNIGLIPVATPIYMCGAVLAKAKLFISGRFHPSILASLGGTPCIFLGAHSHKMRSLQRTLEYDEIKEFSALPTENEIEEILSLSKSHLDKGESMRNKISNVSARCCQEAKKIVNFIRNNI